MPGDGPTTKHTCPGRLPGPCHSRLRLCTSAGGKTPGGGETRATTTSAAATAAAPAQAGSAGRPAPARAGSAWKGRRNQRQAHEGQAGRSHRRGNGPGRNGNRAITVGVRRAHRWLLSAHRTSRGGGSPPVGGGGKDRCKGQGQGQEEAREDQHQDSDHPVRQGQARRDRSGRGDFPRGHHERRPRQAHCFRPGLASRSARPAACPDRSAREANAGNGPRASSAPGKRAAASSTRCSPDLFASSCCSPARATRRTIQLPAARRRPTTRRLCAGSATAGCRPAAGRLPATGRRTPTCRRTPTGSGPATSGVPTAASLLAGSRLSAG